MKDFQVTFTTGFSAGVLLGLTSISVASSVFVLLTSSKWKKIVSLDKNTSNSARIVGHLQNHVTSSRNEKFVPSSSVAKENLNGSMDTTAPDRDAFWFSENLSPSLSIRMSLKSILFEGRSSFQRVQVIETTEFGKTLVMDGQSQSAAADEYIYHESLVHPAMLLHPNPKRIFIGGGGEFATAREVLRHKSVEKCIMVDLDQLACDICRKHLPEWNDGAYEDSRLTVHYSDAKKWLEDNPKEKFDVIILDICDPIEAGPGYKLYTQEFYNFLKSRLNDYGIAVTQSGPGAAFNVKSECFTVINKTLRSAYNCVLPYVCDVPSFGCCWGFNLAIENEDTKNASLKQLFASSTENIEKFIFNKSVQEIDEMIQKRIKGRLRFLDGISFKGLFGIAKSIREECDRETRVMTIDNPVFMYSG